MEIGDRAAVTAPRQAQCAIEVKAAAIRELVATCQWIEKTFDMGADRSQVADPVIIARREIYAGILARIAELKDSVAWWKSCGTAPGPAA